MSYKDSLSAARSRAADGAYHRFLMSYAPGEGIHCFFEGKDDEAFYLCHIERELPPSESLSTYRCGNKVSVQWTRAAIHRKHPNIGSRALFFMDKDLDDFIGVVREPGDDVYETKSYSIENCLVTREMTWHVWASLYHFGDRTKEWAHVREQFDRCLRNFCRLMVPVMAWAAESRAAGTSANLNNVRLATLFEIRASFAVVRKRTTVDTLRYLQRHAGRAPYVSKRAVMRRATQLRSVEPSRWLRGKYATWFFVQFLKRAREYGEHRLPKDRRRLRITVNLAPSTAIEVLGPRARLPSCLVEFIRTHLASVSEPPSSAE